MRKRPKVCRQFYSFSVIQLTFLVKIELRETKRLLITPASVPIIEKFSSPQLPKRNPKITIPRHDTVVQEEPMPNMHQVKNTLKTMVKLLATL